MILIAHIVIAVITLAIASFNLFVPSKGRIHASLGGTMLTILSGSYIIVAQNAAMLSACISGLLFTGFTVSAAVISSKRLQAAVDRQRN